MFDFNNARKVINRSAEAPCMADMFTVKFDYLPSLKSDSMTLSASFFIDDGISYVESIKAIEKNEAINVPPYLAAKDLRNYLITLWPMAVSIQPINKLS